MPELTISEVARQVGLQASAIQYYERIGLLPRAPRISGQRRYDATALYRLAIIQRARQLGFTLTEIRHLFFGFRDITRASERWRTLSQRKLAELDDLMDGINAVRGVLPQPGRSLQVIDLGKNIRRVCEPDAVAPQNSLWNIGIPVRYL